MKAFSLTALILSSLAQAAPCGGQFKQADRILSQVLGNQHALEALLEATQYAHDGVKVKVEEEALIDASNKEYGTRYNLTFVGYYVQPTIGFQDSPTFYRKATVTLTAMERAQCELNPYTTVGQSLISKDQYDRF